MHFIGKRGTICDILNVRETLETRPEENFNSVKQWNVEVNERQGETPLCWDGKELAGDKCYKVLLGKERENSQEQPHESHFGVENIL